MTNKEVEKSLMLIRMDLFRMKETSLHTMTITNEYVQNVIKLDKEITKLYNKTVDLNVGHGLFMVWLSALTAGIIALCFFK